MLERSRNDSRRLATALALWIGAATAFAGLASASGAESQPDGSQSGAAEVQDAQYLFALAQALRHESDYAGAREAYGKALELEPDDPYLRLTFAEFLYDLGELEEAAAQASASRRLDPENPEALRLQARVALRQADKTSDAVENAIRLYAELARMLPNDLEARVSSGRLLMSLGRFEEAATVLREAYELRPDDMRLVSLLLSAYQGSQDHAEAERGLRSLLARFPELLEARLALGNLLAGTGRHRDAAALLKEAPGDQRKSLELIRILTLELYRSGVWQEALAESESWVALAPDETSAGYLNALALSALGRYTEAEEVLRTLHAADQTSFDIVRVLAEVLERQNRAEEAATLLAETVAALESDGRAEEAMQTTLELLDLEARSENWERVIELTAALQADDAFADDGEIALMRGQALLESGRESEAVALFSGLSGDSEVADRARASEAEALFRMGEVEQAERVLMELANAGGIEKVLLVARAMHRLELYQKAIPLWLRAKQDNPDALDVRFWLGSAYERSGNHQSAEGEFRELLERDELFAPALNYLGYMWAERGENLAEALGLVEKAVALEPNNGAYVDSLGWAYFQLGNYEEARGHLEKAARLVGNDAVVFEHLGDVYVALGNRSLAAASYRRALDLEDENEEAVQRKLDQLNGDS